MNLLNGVEHKLIKTNISHHLKLVLWRINFIREKNKNNCLVIRRTRRGTLSGKLNRMNLFILDLIGTKIKIQKLVQNLLFGG